MKDGSLVRYLRRKTATKQQRNPINNQDFMEILGYLAVAAANRDLDSSSAPRVLASLLEGVDPGGEEGVFWF